MKKLCLATLLAFTPLLLASCGVKSPREVADRFVAAETKAWNTGDVEELRALESSDVVYHLPGVDLKGWKAHEDYIQQSRPTISGLKQNWKYLSGEGNHFVMSYESTATVAGKDGQPPMSVANNYLFVFRLNDRKVAEVWTNGSTTNTPIEK